MKTLWETKPKYSATGNWLIAGGVMLCAGAIYFTTQHGKRTKKKVIDFLRGMKPVTQDAKANVADLVDDVRDHVRRKANFLMGDEKHQKMASEIHPSGTPSKAWKEAKEPNIFPKEKQHLN